MPDSNDNLPIPTHKFMPAKPSEVQIIEHGRDIHMFKITDLEIDELVTNYMSIDFGLFALCIGIFIAFLVALATAQLSDKVFATFVALILVAFLGTIFFGFRARRERQRAKQRVQQIKESRKI